MSPIKVNQVSTLMWLILGKLRHIPHSPRDMLARRPVFFHINIPPGEMEQLVMIAFERLIQQGYIEVIGNFSEGDRYSGQPCRKKV